MAIMLVTYDLKQPGRDYQPVFDHIKTNYTWCKGLESVWLLDTTKTAQTIRDELKALVDSNDKVFVTRLQGNWGSFNYYCGDWLNKPERNW
ncbi:hypothetical protein D2V04_13295 [Pelagerythrobacter aerophilus]|uniref:CRISPR-associated protein Cas2 n=1 Tax=Pelagerythrobacter aerophilus TaxID=2306995 RepID=A0A418NG97_9SPHN|nr:hypothetical protein D2V04_13295 [Pelagerythrobacter aerophilus]